MLKNQTLFRPRTKTPKMIFISQTMFSEGWLIIRTFCNGHGSRDRLARHLSNKIADAASLSSIPLEILLQILWKLDTTDIVRSGLVSHDA